jgi:O-antigen/teichoic acid export membrane protein
MKKSIKVNLALNIINTVSQVFFPLITFPYASRIMGPVGIGQVNFFNSIIGYIALFMSLGIPMYAVREIARVRDDIRKMETTVMEIFVLQSMLTFLGYVVVVIISIFVPEVKQNVHLFLILSLTLIFTTIGCDWFYQGMEDFFYITVRGIIFKLVSIILLFVLVHSKNDLLLYGVYCVVGSVGSNIFNFLRLRKFIHRKDVIFTQIHPFRHLKPAIQIFVLNIVVSVYLQLNTVMLGFYKDSEAVGFYTAATKLMSVVLSISNALGTVIMPRMSNLIAEHKMEEFSKLAQKSYNFSYALTLPLSVGLFFVAPYAIRVLCGSQFLPAVSAARIVAPIIFVVSFSGFMGTQTLYPMGKVKLIIISTSLGCLVDLILNIILMPLLSYNAAAISYLGAEFIVSLSMYILAHKLMPIRFVNRSVENYTFCSFLMGMSLLFLSFFHFNALIQLFVMVFVGFVIYLGGLIIRKDDFALEIVNMIQNKIKR